MPFLEPGLLMSELVSGKGLEGEEERKDQLEAELLARPLCG